MADTPAARPGTRLHEMFGLVALMGGAGLVLCAVAVLSLGDEVDHLGGAFWLITGLLVLGELRPVVASGQYDPAGVNVSLAFVFAVLFTWGPWPAVLVQAFAMLLGEVVRRRAWWRVVFNTGQYVVCLGAAWVVLWSFDLRPSPTDPLEVTGKLLPVIALSWVVYFFCNMVFVSLALSLYHGTSFREEFLDDFGYFTVTMFAVLALSPVVFVVASDAWQMLPLLLLPLFLV